MADGALQEVTEAAFSGVMRAMDARKLDFAKWPGPIIVGIIAWPALEKEAFSQVGRPK